MHIHKCFGLHYFCKSYVMDILVLLLFFHDVILLYIMIIISNFNKTWMLNFIVSC